MFQVWPGTLKGGVPQATYPLRTRKRALKANVVGLDALLVKPPGF